VSKLLTIEEWANRRYSSPPSKRTLRRWIKDAKIVPVPKKEGRRYVVSEHAQFVDWSDPDSAASCIVESQETQLG
jgi:hypothetical protein